MQASHSSWKSCRNKFVLECPGIYKFFSFCPGKSNRNTGSAPTANVDSTSLITFEKHLTRIGAAMRGEEDAASKLVAKLMLKVGKIFIRFQAPHNYFSKELNGVHA